MLAFSCFCIGASDAHQVLQTTDETVVMGLVTVQGQSVIVRVVAWFVMLVNCQGVRVENRCPWSFGPRV